MYKKKVFSGLPGDCSDQQLEVLAKFRNAIRSLEESQQYDDAYLLRFLRARKFDLEKTMQMWTNFIKWRKEKKVDQIFKMDFSDITTSKAYYPHTWFRTDKEGRPIYIERVGKLDLENLMKCTNEERFEMYFIQDYEKLLKEKFPACSKAKGEPVTTTFYIMDLKGAAANMMSSKFRDILKMASKIGQDYYPEILGHMFIVNAPMFFYGMWNVIKHFVDEKTRKKVHILGSNFKKDLLKYVEEDNLPDFLGGKATVEDYGPNLSNQQGPWMNRNTNQSSIDTEIIGNGDIQLENDIISHHSKGDLEDSNIKKHTVLKAPFIHQDHELLGYFEDFELLDIAEEPSLNGGLQDFRSHPSILFNYVKRLDCYGR